MPDRVNGAPSLHSMATGKRPIAFELPRRLSSEDRPQRPRASAELIYRLPNRSHTVNVILMGCLPFSKPDSPESPLGPLLRTVASPRSGPRRCNSEPNEHMRKGSAVEVVVTSGRANRMYRRCNSEPNQSPPTHISPLETIPQSPNPGLVKLKASQNRQEECRPESSLVTVVPQSSPPVRIKPLPRRHHSEPLNCRVRVCRAGSAKGGPRRAMSHPNPECLPRCDLLEAYQEALSFHRKLREDYETSKRLFILHRYERLRNLIQEATLEQQLIQIRQWMLCKCSCRDSMSTVERLFEDLPEVTCSTLDKIKTYLQSALSYLVSTPTMSSSAVLQTSESPTTTSRPDEHEWQRSRIVLLERHLQRLRRECLSMSERSSLPFQRYKAMKSSLKHVLNARMV